MRTIIVMMFVASMLFGTSFAQSIITFDVDTTKFSPGEIVELNGHVDDGLEGQPVAVEIKDSDGNIILIRTVTSDSNGDFTLKFKVPSTASSGEFDIVTNVEVDGQTFSGVETSNAVEPEPEPESTSESSSFEPVCGPGTVYEDGMCVVDKSQETQKEVIEEKLSSKGGGCLIATATYGSELAPQVQQLREIRDSKLLQTESGTSFMGMFNDVYYSFSPIIADYERENPHFKEIVKIGLTPMLTSLSLMDYADSESSVLGIGISLIILNGLMYVGIPIFGIVMIRKIPNQKI